MEEILPILVDGRNVARAIIKRGIRQATKAAEAAASHISTPMDIQLCPFSDGSHDSNNRGGVGLAHRRQWLPQGWASEHAKTDLNGDFVEKAWPYGHANNNMLMEAVGIIEALYAADESIEQHLPVLKKHTCTVTVKAMTDCQPMLAHIVRQTPPGGKVKQAIPRQLIKQIKDQTLALQSHGITVFVEIHWCPRNKVPQLILADMLAGEARKRSLAYYNATENIWARATESTIMKKLLLLLSGSIGFAQIPKKINNSATTLEKTITAKNMTQVKKESRKARHTANVATASLKTTVDLQPKFPVPETVLPPKPAITSNIRPTTTTAEPTTTPSTKPMASAAEDAHLPEKPIKAEAVKRKVEEVMEGSEGMPNKKPKLSPDRKRQEKQRQPLTMPASWALDPYLSDTEGEVTGDPAPSIRRNLQSTQETGEINVFINDGVRPFSLAKPIGIVLPD